MSAFVLSQILAAGTFVLALIAYQTRNQKHVLALLAAAQVCLSIHFLLLGSLVGAVVAVLSATRFLVSIWTKYYILKYVFIISTISIGVYLYTTWFDVLSIAASVLGTMAAFTQTDQRMRLFLIGGTVAMLLFNISLGSPVAVVSGLFFLVSGLTGYWRFYLRKKPSKTQVAD